ncbi:MAG TPA: cytochrome c maturation protein CcmE, partial [Acidobacteriaceae bacterium]
MQQPSQTLRIGLVAVIVLGVIAWLAVSGIQSNKSYYVTITELQGMGDKAYTRHLRVAGNVAPGTIERSGTHAQFVL